MMKKAQAALEFLMTYGWAILVVLAAIGALAYFGVLSPSNFLPSKCTAGVGMACLGQPSLDPALTQVYFVVQNGVGGDLDATDTVGVTSPVGCTTAFCRGRGVIAGCATPIAAGAGGNPGAGVVTDGEIITVVGTCNTITATSRTYKGAWTFDYIDPESNFAKQIIVDVSAKT